MKVIVMLLLLVSVAFAIDDKAVLQERAARVQAEFALGQKMVEKAQLEYNLIQAQLKDLDSKPTSTVKKEK